MMDNSRARQWRKIIISGILFCISISAIATHYVASIYPFWPAAVLIMILLCIFLYVFTCVSERTILILLVFVSVLYRTFIFSFPASLIGMDPDTFVVWVQSIIETGHTNIIPHSFYSDASGFMVLISEVAITTGLDSWNAVIIVPLLIGLFMPLLAYLIATRFRFSLLRIGAPAIAAVSTFATIRSFAPIAQSLAMILLGITFYLFLSGSYRKLILILTILPILVIFHKLQLIIIVIFFVWYLVLSVISRYFNSQNVMLNHRIISTRIVVSLLLLSSTLYYIQSHYITSNLPTILGNILGWWTVSKSVIDPVPAGGEYYSAVIYSTIIRVVHRGSLLITSGISWILLIEFRNRHDIRSILAFSSTIAMFSMLGVLNFTMMSRFMFSGEFLLTVTSCASIFLIITKIDGLRGRKIANVYFPVVFIVLIVITQLFLSPVAVPDNPSGPRYYLEENELAAKEFGLTYTNDDIATDFFFASERTKGQIKALEVVQTQKYKSESIEIMDGNISNSNYKYILLRNISIYTSKDGLYRVNWNPQSKYDRELDRIYQSGETVIYGSIESI